MSAWGFQTALRALIILALLLVVDSSGGQQPRGFEDINLAHFRDALGKLWHRLTDRDPLELVSKIVLELGHQQVSRLEFCCHILWGIRI